MEVCNGHGTARWPRRWNGRQIVSQAWIAVRWFKGKVLLVAKGNLWNGDPATYDGRSQQNVG
jgi:hypothetical protein